MKYYDKIGFWEKDVETAPGVYQSKIVEKDYTGDIIENRQRWNDNQQINDNLTITNRISIIADMYFNEHMSSIKYVKYLGTKWKVNSLSINYPRVILELGEVYNGVNTR